MNKCLNNALLICHKGIFKIPRLQSPNQGSHMTEFLLSLESVCMIAISTLTGMQLISNEEKMLG